MHRLLEYENADLLSRDLVRTIADRAGRAVSENGRFTLCLSGGNSPRPAYRLLAEARMPWAETHVFFGDERMVPPDHQWSNYNMANAALLSRVPVPPANVHRIRGEWANAGDAARDYEERMRAVFGRHADRPAMDLCLLGLGPDGHTASLFPGRDFPGDGDAWAVAVARTALEPRVERVSLGLSALIASKCICFIAPGEKKRPLVDSILKDREAAARRYPAAMVNGEHVSWFVEKAPDSGEKS